MPRCHVTPGRFSPGAVLAAAALGLACAKSPPSTAPAPVPTPPERHAAPAALTIARAPLPAPNPKLPPVPDVDGPLAIKVVYPPRNAVIGSRDSNFVFGSVGNGNAGLTINGNLVPVWPNGAFLGWVPNPPADSQWYDLEAYTLRDTVRLRFPARTREGIGPRPPVTPEITELAHPIVAVLHDDSLDRTVSDTDNVIIGRPTPTGDYKWFLLPGTIVRVLEYRDDMARVQLDRGQDVWVDRRDVKPRRRSTSAKPLTMALR